MRLLFALAAAVLLPTTVLALGQPLVVHEWGTFTSLQDESGRTVGGINTDDEPVPQFVHTLGHGVLLKPTDLPNTLVKGYPSLHPDVTLRLETPVMYFYPADDTERQVTVRATFRGGWLTEYYPSAQTEAPGFLVKRPLGGTAIGGLDSSTEGALVWQDLRVGTTGQGPRTHEEVWLAPRRVRAATVSTPAGESEKYLFYRGVGHVEAPLRTVISGDWLKIATGSSGQFHRQWVSDAWLADIRQDGTCAFRRIGRIALGGPAVTVQARFDAQDYSAHSMGQLRHAMHEALVADGLFDDEATAMLDTWQAAYFGSAGLRLFYMVPQAWTDHVLPLEFSRDVDLTRVMIGRIELITPKQRQLLRQLAAAPAEAFPAASVNEAIQRGMTSDQDYFRKLLTGQISLLDLGVSEIPPSYLAYRDLGRLRNALILHELALRPTPELERFVSNYGLAGYDVPSQTTGNALPDPATAVADDVWGRQPDVLQLEQNVPNPFNPETTIRFSLPQSQPVDLAIYDLAGQTVATLARTDYPAGYHTLNWDGRDQQGRAVASGVYLYRLSTPTTTQTRKLLLLR